MNENAVVFAVLQTNLVVYFYKSYLYIFADSSAIIYFYLIY